MLAPRGAIRLAQPGTIERKCVGGPRPICVARALKEVSTGRRGPVTGYIDAARDWLAGQDDVDADRLGVIGFCMGGGFALLFAGTGPEGVKAAAANYAPVPGNIEALRRICPVVASYGGRDKSLPGHVKRLGRHLETLGVDHDVKVYDNAGHSFMTQGKHPVAQLLMVPMRLGYVEDAAQDAWRRVFSFFDARLKEAA